MNTWLEVDRLACAFHNLSARGIQADGPMSNTRAIDHGRVSTVLFPARFVTPSIGVKHELSIEFCFAG
jgi:hypothetical protein